MHFLSAAKHRDAWPLAWFVRVGSVCEQIPFVWKVALASVGNKDVALSNTRIAGCCVRAVLANHFYAQRHPSWLDRLPVSGGQIFEHHSTEYHSPQTPRCDAPRNVTLPSPSGR